MHSPPPRIHFVADHDQSKPPADPRRRSFDSAPRYRRAASMLPYPSTSESDPALAAFSDEYDLSQEDPRILQDVQRALKLKARRETTLKRHSMNKPTQESYLSPAGYPMKGAGAFLPLATNPDYSTGSDVDFGPSVGSNAIADGHPVPSSSDNGITLDWTGAGSDSDKRWSLPIRRKGKEALPHLNVLVQQQDKVYSERLDKIQREASRPTLQKASITRDQLTRRYALLNGPSFSHFPPLTQVSRWYDSQEPGAKAVIEASEPPTWLKHLQRRRKTTVRSPWQLTAGIMEEYIRAHNANSLAYPFNEDVTTDMLSRRSLSPPGISLAPVTSRGSSHISFDPLIPRRSSFEGPLSFEPLTRSTRDSLDVASRRSGESGYSSPGSKSLNTSDIGLLGGKRWPSDFSTRLQRKVTREGEGIMSTRDSLLDVSENDLEDPFKIDENRAPDNRITVIVTADSGSQIAPPEATDTPSADVVESSYFLTLNQIAGDTVDRVSRCLAPWIETKQGKPINQERIRREYDAKALLLHEVTAQNYRIRQLLNRVSVVVKEYEVAQSNALASLGDHHQLRRLPRELLEVFSHDPAAVTGPTRRLRGWRAVDDIHRRLVKQRAICRRFLSEHIEKTGSNFGSVLREPANTLNSSLGSLEQFTNTIQFKAREVDELLKQVQYTHAEVKTNYNDALSHTSAVYPELSVISRLEESYKDQYQQFWEIGMDALTLILDSVTPFWRTYGKTIGEDIRDFLIIPLYRNEFTGEAKRYPITRVPARSLRHWLGLCLFCMASFTIALLQTRIAIASHGGLRYIPYEGVRWTALPFFWVMIVIQWLIVVTEYVVLILELGVVLWWAGWSIKLFS